MAIYQDQRGRYVMVDKGVAGNYAFFRKSVIGGRGSRIQIRGSSGIGDVPGIGGFFTSPADAETALADYAAKQGWSKLDPKALAALVHADTRKADISNGFEDPLFRKPDFQAGDRVYTIYDRPPDPADPDAQQVVKWGVSRFGNRDDKEMQAAVSIYAELGKTPLNIESIPEPMKFQSAEQMLEHRIRNAKARIKKKDPLFYDEQLAKEMSRPKYTIEACRADLAYKQKVEKEWIAKWWAKHSQDKRIEIPPEGLPVWKSKIRAAKTVEEIAAVFGELGMMVFSDGTRLDSMGVRTADAGDLKGVDAGIAKTLEKINAAGFPTCQSMSGLKEDYENAPKRYSPDGYIAFYKERLTPEKIDQIEAAAKSAGLAFDGNADIFFQPAVEVRTGMMKNGQADGDLFEEANRLATAQIVEKYDDVELSEVRPSILFPSKMTGGTPTGPKYGNMWLDLRDQIHKELKAAAGGNIDDDEIKRRWKAFESALVGGADERIP